MKRNLTMTGAIAALAMFSLAGSALANVPDVRLRARLGSNDALRGSADYRERQRDSLFVQRFSVGVENAQPGQTLEVRVNGALFGTITANALGRAELEFRTATPDNNPQDEEPPLDPNFPRLHAGDAVSIGSLTGTFR